MEDKNLLPKPHPMRGPSGNRDKNHYCAYHREHRHDTNECRTLKAEIEKLIKWGYLKEFVNKRGQEMNTRGRGYSPPREPNNDRQRRDRKSPPPPVTGRINTISGGSA
ncbi:hypothetical protein LIER_20012 [Lithospermum erythrorhizon]|uniref:Reverse transcriptase domain-containing protein n=1 Tax=Lithospermum erythrorhizon TaxID=34254 RepID=A0AAV3QJZ5_LITER